MILWDLLRRSRRSKNWERIARGNTNGPLYASFIESIDLELPWITLIKSSLESIGLLNFYLDSYASQPPFVYKRFYDRLCDIFHQETFSKIQNQESKLRTYAVFKKCLGYENYLSNIKNTTIRKNVTKFRLSNHKLMIEVGRHQKIPANERFCPFCPQKIENEIHFLFYCPSYRIQRSTYLNPITDALHNFSFLPDHQKLELLFSDMDHNVCTFISKSMEVREFLIDRPKRHQ